MIMLFQKLLYQICFNILLWSGKKMVKFKHVPIIDIIVYTSIFVYFV